MVLAILKFMSDSETKPSSSRGSICTTIRELGPKIPYYRRNYGSQFPDGCICGPSGSMLNACLKLGHRICSLVVKSVCKTLRMETRAQAWIFSSPKGPCIGTVDVW